MKSFIIPGILWSYLLSVVLAIRFWGGVYDKLMALLDLSPSQGWILPLAVNLLVACIGIPQVAVFIVSQRRRDSVSGSRVVASILCTVAVALLCVATGLGVVRTRKHLATAASELMTGSKTDVFAAGEIVDDFYSNKVVGVVMELPKGWYPMTLNAMRRAKRSGAYAVAGDDTQRAEELARDRLGIHALLAIRRYPDSHPGYNPSLTLFAFDKRVIATFGVGNLQAFARSHAAPANPYHVKSGPLRERVGTETYYHLQIEGRFPQATIQQHLYFTETTSFYVVATASVMDEVDLGPMQQAVATLQVNPKIL